MPHTLLYFGPFEQNFRSLSSKTVEYIDWDDKTKLPVQGATKRASGRLQFRYMCSSRRPGENVVVGVCSDDSSIVLRAPVLLIHERHMGGTWFAANNRGYLDDDCAMHLLADMIVANPEHRDALGRLLLWLGKNPETTSKKTRKRVDE